MMQDNSTVLIHGNSRVVNALILKAAESKQFNVIVTEGKPTCDGSGPRYIFQTQFLVWYCVYVCVCTYMYYFWELQFPKAQVYLKQEICLSLVSFV